MGTQHNIINGEYVRHFIMSESDVITRRLMIAINYYLGMHINRGSLPQPEADFDALFFMVVIRDFCREHEFIRDILNGKEINSFEAD